MEWLLDVVKITVPLAFTVLIWFLNARESRAFEERKRMFDERKRREERYVAMLTHLKGFYSEADPMTAKESKDEFLSQLSMSWLNCPDSVIKACYTFLDQVRVGAEASDKDRECALAAVVSEMRQDVGVPTALTASDYRHLGSR